MIARTGQADGCPERPWPTTSPLLPFFWVTKVRLTKVIADRSSMEAVTYWIGVLLIHKPTSWMRKGWERFVVSVYSPGRSKKKNASHIMSAAARDSASPAAVAMSYAPWRIGRGMGLRRLGGGSWLWYPRSWRAMRGSMVPLPASVRGSALPSMVCACATNRTASATVPHLTGWPLAASRPSRTR